LQVDFPDLIILGLDRRARLALLERVCCHTVHPGNKTIVPNILFRLLPLALALTLGACAATVPSSDPAQAPAVPGYEGIQDGEFFIAPVQAQYLPDHVRRREVAWVGDEQPGDIIVDTHARVL